MENPCSLNRLKPRWAVRCTDFSSGHRGGSKPKSAAGRSRKTATWQNALLICGARKRGIQTAVISLLVHRLFHKHKGIFSLFAVCNTLQTVVVVVSDCALNFTCQFWPDKNCFRGYKGKNISYCSAVPRCPPFSSCRWATPASCNEALQTSRKVCDGMNWSKNRYSSQNCRNVPWTGDDGPVGVLAYPSKRLSMWLAKELGIFFFFWEVLWSLVLARPRNITLI